MELITKACMDGQIKVGATLTAEVRPLAPVARQDSTLTFRVIGITSAFALVDMLELS